jgi:hypothetical protein
MFSVTSDVTGVSGYRTHSQIHVPSQRPRYIGFNPTDAIAEPQLRVDSFREMHRRLAETIRFIRSGRVLDRAGIHQNPYDTMRPSG